MRKQNWTAIVIGGVLSTLGVASAQAASCPNLSGAYTNTKGEKGKIEQRGCESVTFVDERGERIQVLVDGKLHPLHELSRDGSIDTRMSGKYDGERLVINTQVSVLDEVEGSATRGKKVLISKANLEVVRTPRGQLEFLSRYYDSSDKLQKEIRESTSTATL